MFQSKTNPEKRFGSIFVQKRYDKEHKDSDHAKAQIYCMRHGQTALDDLHRSDGWLDLPLNDDGRKNVVINFDEYLKDVPIKKIFSSPLRRTEETAHIIESGMPDHPEVETVPELKTWNLGSLAGGKKKPNKKIVKDLLANPHKSAPDGESYDEFKDRFDSKIKELEKEAEKEGPFLIIFSGSNCRRLSEMLFDDRNVLDIDEAGIFVLYKRSDGSWTAKELKGLRSDEDKEKNPEAS